MANVVEHTMKKRRAPDFISLVDFWKAFDSVLLDYLLQVKNRMGF
jgi:hypothetical protein